jgi:hypothetical protein
VVEVVRKLDQRTVTAVLGGQRWNTVESVRTASRRLPESAIAGARGRHGSFGRNVALP